MIETALFYILSASALFMAILTIASRSPIHSAIALVWCLCSVAGIFAVLDASFLATVQVMVYAGAILVLFVFVIMLLNLSEEELGQPLRPFFKWVGLLLALLFGVGFSLRVLQMPAPHKPEIIASFGTIESMGRMLFGNNLLPFEVVSVVLLAAILGAVVIAKKKIW